MSFHSRTVTRELKSIPFDQAYQIYKSTYDLVLDDLNQQSLAKYQEYIQGLEQAWASTHEAPYEGNFSEEHPFKPDPKARLAARREAQRALQEQFIPRYKLDTIMQLWVMPQIITHLASKPFRLGELLETAAGAQTAAVEGRGAQSAQTVAVEGQLDPLKVLNHLFNTKDPWDMGLYQFLMLDSRSSYLKTQYKGDAKQFCALVPLIMYVFKLHHKIPYSRWSRTNLQYVVNDSLYQAMVCDYPDDLTAEELLAARDQGLIYKTGAKAGEMRNPTSTYKLYDTTETRIHGLPELAKTMLTQIWCAHPQNRSRFMILDPKNWDKMPTPLVTSSVFTPVDNYVPVYAEENSANELPWM